ncbi:MAG: ABC transporter ATP-binding protein [Anaerolineaceae bacterium]|nr:ABC transporter ATP-binding protein [Anaerolineaceae bacterium]
MDKNSTYIELKDISKVFHTGGGDFVALDHIQLSFNRGEFVSVVGKSGSGKSTLMNMITGIDRPTNGEVVVAEKKIHQLPETDLAKWRGLNLGIVFQFYQLLPVLSILENVMLPMEIAGLHSAKDCEERALHLLEQVNLKDQADKLPDEVAGGQQQSAAIARALANNPPILIADEPTGNLDSTSANQIIQLFEKFSEQGKTIIMVTHDQELARRAGRQIKLIDGRLQSDAIIDLEEEVEIVEPEKHNWFSIFRRRKA